MTINKNPEFLEGLQNRVSHAILTEPAPNKSVLEQCYKAAFRAPDHAYLRPWRFIEVRGQQREALGELMAKAVLANDADAAEAVVAKAQKGPLRAPLVIIAVAHIQDHPKVPAWEQIVATGCAAQNIVAAAYAQGFGAVWRTGALADSEYLVEALGLEKTDKIVGFLYLGTPSNDDKHIQRLVVEDYVTELSLK
ncbi:nitroreductase family protein [Reinekea marina]|uniref:Putative NAD(P)H nitroreductase n=1 Tax=Reinekea marina TaxID=1310421 RepID=A0ABV7WVW2_9GAMM|nr:nitroreductase family protein [Reinekea marina]MDN3650160.1 nitroreductase family protein [Reinekea marina]